MNRNRFALCFLVASIWVFLGLRGAMAQPTPLGPETRVDTVQGKHPLEPMLAVQPDGEFEIAWGYSSPTAPFVAARHFAADGTPTQTTQVSLGGPSGFARVNAVTATPGGFEVLWQTANWPVEPNLRRHLDLNGVPDPGKPVRLGKTAFSTRWVWQVRGHGFFGGWPILKNHSSIGLAIQRMTPAGVLTGTVQRLSTRPVIADERPVLTALPNGGFVAAWYGIVAQPDLSYRSVVRARLFSPAGKPIGSDLDVNSIDPGPNDIVRPQVAADPRGGFAVIWLFSDGTAEGFKPYLRFFDDAGRPRGPEIQGPNRLVAESLAFDDAGNLLVLWAENQGTVGSDLKVQLFDSDGASLGPPASVASEASKQQFNRPFRGNVAWGGSSWIVVWEAEADTPGPDAVFVRRFAE
jgi:hypothetical protein